MLLGGHPLQAELLGIEGDLDLILAQGVPLLEQRGPLETVLIGDGGNVVPPVERFELLLFAGERLDVDVQFDRREPPFS